MSQDNPTTETNLSEADRLVLKYLDALKERGMALPPFDIGSVSQFASWLIRTHDVYASDGVTHG